jgi:hypothetical protein
MNFFDRLFGRRSPAGHAAAPMMRRAPEPLRFRVEEAQPLRGSPSGTRAWIARAGNAGQEARFRFELTPAVSQVSEHFGFAGGAFWREPAPASMLPLLLQAFGASAPAAEIFKASKAPIAVEKLDADDGWFTAQVRLQESKAVVEVRFSLSEGFGEMRLTDPASAQAVVDELAQVL